MKNAGTQTIVTKDLILRRFCEDDCQDVWVNWAADPQVQNLYCEPVYTTQEEVQQLLQKYIESYEKEHVYRWAVIERDTSVCIGQIAYFLVDVKNHFGEIEYCIGRGFQNKGYATQATMAVVDYGFLEIEFNRIVISHRSDNEASKRVIEKCCFQYEGCFNQAFFIDENYVDRLFYAKLKENYQTP